MKAELDEPPFRKVDKLSNNREEWKEWKLHFLTAIRECDAPFANWLLGHEKDVLPFDMAKLDPTQLQLSAILQSRLIALTTKQAFQIVESTNGNGIEPWRLMFQHYDPQTDHRFAVLLTLKNRERNRCPSRPPQVGVPVTGLGQGP